MPAICHEEGTGISSKRESSKSAASNPGVRSARDQAKRNFHLPSSTSSVPPPANQARAWV